MGKGKRKAQPSQVRGTKKTKPENPTPTLTAPSLVEDNKAALARLIGKYTKFVDPLVRFTFNTKNTTASERRDVFKAANLFMRRGPNVAAGPLPAALTGVKGLPSWDAGIETVEIRFSGAQQVANWIADAQARGYAAGLGVVRFTVELTSDNGRHWSAPFEILH